MKIINAHDNDDDDDDEEEEEMEEDRVDLFVLFSSCRHLPVGHFFASSSPLSATKLGIVTIRTIVGLLQDFRHFDGEVFLIGVTINYEDQNYLYMDGKTGVGWIVKMMISGVKNLTKLMGLKGRHYVLLAL